MIKFKKVLCTALALVCFASAAPQTLAYTDIAAGEGVTPALEKPFHKLVKKVTEDIDTMKFNTAVASMMTYLNTVAECGNMTRTELRDFAKVLSPFAPHVAEEGYAAMGGEGLCSLAPWPTFEESKTVDDTVEMPVQIMG